MRKEKKMRIEPYNHDDFWSEQKYIILQMVFCLEAVKIDQSDDIKFHIEKVLDLMKEKIILW